MLVLAGRMQVSACAEDFCKLRIEVRPTATRQGRVAKLFKNLFSVLPTSQRTLNQRDVGSNPTAPTIVFLIRLPMAVVVVAE